MAKEKQSWERQKGESAKAYYRFKVFLELPPDQRTLDNTLQKLNQNEPNPQNKTNISSLKHMSTKWAWFERASLYDSNLVLKEMEENEIEFKQTNKEFKNVFKETLNFANDLLKELIDNVKDNALSTRINMLNTLMNVLDALYRNYRLSCGRSTRITESTVDANVDANVEMIGEENIHELTKEDLEEILSANDDNEDFTDNL